MNEFERITDLTTVSLALELLRDMRIGALGKPLPEHLQEQMKNLVKLLSEQLIGGDIKGVL